MVESPQQKKNKKFTDKKILLRTSQKNPINNRQLKTEEIMKQNTNFYGVTSKKKSCYRVHGNEKANDDFFGWQINPLLIPFLPNKCLLPWE